jgi:fatty-acyl-CoA synthase
MRRFERRLVRAVARTVSVNLASFLERHARVRGGRLAVLDGEARIDFATLNARSDRLANALAHRGAGPGDRVAVRMPNRHQYLECLFACAKRGLVLAPIDRSLTSDEVEHVLRDSGAGVFVDGVEAVDDLVECGANAPPEPRAGDDDPLLLMYTSGTTGRPKGVLLSHRNVLYTSFNQILGWRLTCDDRALVVAPFHHVGGLLVLGLPCLHAGGSVRLGTPEPAALVEDLVRDRLTAVFLSPYLWRQVAELDSLESYALEAVRLCASGGEPIPTETLRRLLVTFGAEFTDAYGLTEAASVSTLLNGTDVLRKAGSAGLPCTHNRVRVLAPDGRDAAPGEPGQLVQAGPTVMLGYWQRQAETAEALRDGWLRTGDEALFDDDRYLYIAGRSKDLIVSAAGKVYPAEVERVLREHPAIADAAVIGIPEGLVGETVAAVVIPRAGATLTGDEVVAFCRGRIADFKRPTHAFFSETLPRNANGKVQKAVLRRIYGSRA